MAKKKAQETIVLVRLPNAESKDGIGTLTIQRGDLGHLMEFAYRGLTLRGNIAEAVQTALIALAQLEASPPPHLTAEASDGEGNENTTETPPPDEADNDSEVITETPPLDEVDDDSEVTSEAPPTDEADDSEITDEALPQDDLEITTQTPLSAEVKPPPSVTTPVVMNPAASANQAQLALI